MPPAPACAKAGPPSPEVTGAFCRVPSTPFSQAPRYALPVHLCRFRVRSSCRCCFPEVPGRPPNPIRANDVRPSSHSGRRRNINPLPIGYGSRPRLRGPANPARINLAQEPLDFRRQRFSRCLSLLMSAFALPIPPGGVTPLPSQAYGTLRYRSNNYRQSTLAKLTLSKHRPTVNDQSRSFGTWFEPRYIFGARFLLDQ